MPVEPAPALQDRPQTPAGELLLHWSQSGYGHTCALKYAQGTSDITLSAHLECRICKSQLQRPCMAQLKIACMTCCPSMQLHALCFNGIATTQVPGLFNAQCAAKLNLEPLTQMQAASKGISSPAESKLAFTSRTAAAAAAAKRKPLSEQQPPAALRRLSPSARRSSTVLEPGESWASMD